MGASKDFSKEKEFPKYAVLQNSLCFWITFVKFRRRGALGTCVLLEIPQTQTTKAQSV